MIDKHTNNIDTMNLMGLFEQLPDPRDRNIRYKLSDILVMSLLAMYIGCTDFVGIEIFCDCKKHLLNKWFGITKIPSHDTFNRLFKLLDNDTFESFFTLLMTPHLNTTLLGLKQIALDGKTVSNADLHLVTAFSSQTGMSIASKDTGKGKKNELATMIEMVEHLKLKDCVVTTNAMGCNEKLFAAIKNQGGDYTIQLKANQKNALNSVRTHFDCKPNQSPTVTDDATKERTGLVERAYFMHSTLKDFPDLEFTGLKTIVKVLKTITKKDGSVKTEQRYYLTSLLDPVQIAASIRGHWAIENSLHWRLDVQFKEDGSKVLDKNCQKNLNLLRKLVINHFKSQKVSNFSKHMQRMAFNEDNLIREIKQLLRAK
jgi:predicted transposase YbfD/YdcC